MVVVFFWWRWRRGGGEVGLFPPLSFFFSFKAMVVVVVVGCGCQWQSIVVGREGVLVGVVVCWGSGGGYIKSQSFEFFDVPVP